MYNQRRWLRLVFFSWIALSFSLEAHATLYFDNSSYPSLPGLFGGYMVEGKTYRARLQFLHENPYLCEDFDPNMTSYVHPSPHNIGTEQTNIIIVDSVVLLAARGNCPFYQKAMVAQSMDSSVRFLMVYNYEPEMGEEDGLVPMYSEYGNTALILLSLSHSTGRALKKYIGKQPETMILQGGPTILFDSVPPDGIASALQLQEMVLSALGLFFMLISFTGCMLILAGTYGQLQQEGGGLFVTPAQNSGARMRRRVLTEDQIHQLAAYMKSQRSQEAAAAETQLQNNEKPCEEDEPDSSCAVCIEDLGSDEDTIQLPCNHRFHTGCIIPWLTERQTKCPLCKYDVLEKVREMEDEMLTGGANSSSLLDRVLRYRWTVLSTQDEDLEGRDGIMIPAEEMVDTRDEQSEGVEMSERTRPEQQLS